MRPLINLHSIIHQVRQFNFPTLILRIRKFRLLNSNYFLLTKKLDHIHIIQCSRLNLSHFDFCTLYSILEKYESESQF